MDPSSSSTSGSSEYDFARICRSCRKEDYYSQTIFDSVGSNGIRLDEMLASCVHKQIPKNDGMPDRLCRKCVWDVTAAYDFQQRFTESDALLREYLSRRKVLPTVVVRDDATSGDVSVKMEMIDIKQEFPYGDLDPLQEQNEREQAALAPIPEAITVLNVDEAEGEYMEADVDPSGFDHYSDMDNDGGNVSSGDEDEDSKPLMSLISEESKAEMERLIATVVAEAGVTMDPNSTTCPICSKSFPKRYHLNRHMRCHLTSPQFVCDLCNTGFTRREHLYRHMKTHNPSEKKLECPQCHKRFIRRDHIRVHLKTHNMTPEGIEEVMQSFPVETPDRKRADKEDDSAEPKGPKECHVCGKKFLRAFRLKRHLLTHEADIECGHCDRKFAAVSYRDYKSHMEADHPGLPLQPEKIIEGDDSDERPYKCELCDRAFQRKTHMTRHMTMHLASRQFECSVCQKAFNRKDNLQTHLRMHVKDGVLIEEQVQQILDEKERDIKQALARGEQIKKEGGVDEADDDDDGLDDIFKKPELAESMKRKQCPFCSRTFNRFYHLKRHMKLHGIGVDPNEKSKDDMDEIDDKMKAVCRICDATFDKITPLRNHLRIHMNPESFSELNIRSKPYLFEEGFIVENYVDYLVQKICAWNVSRFYMIIEPDGEELCLSDSDSEPEDGDEPLDGIVRREHTCLVCQQSFPRIKQIMEHAQSTHQTEQLLSCMHCSRTFPSNDLLVRHCKLQCENQHKKFFCSFCGERFMWQISLSRHTKQKHDQKENKFFCEVCHRGFARNEHLLRHYRVHDPSEKKFECPHCQKKFNRKDNLRSHIKIHTRGPNEVKEPTHLCVLCGKSFTTSFNYTVHMRRHTGERPYKCDICGKGFPRTLDMQSHRRTHTGEKPFSCEVCGKSFSRSCRLVLHRRVHTGEKPYKCTYCERAFAQPNDLTLHIRRHTGEKPYVCGICNERFIQGTALRAHQRTAGHYEERKYERYTLASQ